MKQTRIIIRIKAEKLEQVKELIESVIRLNGQIEQSNGLILDGRNFERILENDD